jgi:hypothetical protein
MTKLLSLVAVLGFLAAPAFAADEMKATATTGATKAEITVDCSKATDKAKCESDAKMAAKEAAKNAPAAGEVKMEKKEEKKM